MAVAKPECREDCGIAPELASTAATRSARQVRTRDPSEHKQAERSGASFRSERRWNGDLWPSYASGVMQYFRNRRQMKADYSANYFQGQDYTPRLLLARSPSDASARPTGLAQANVLPVEKRQEEWPIKDTHVTSTTDSANAYGDLRGGGAAENGASVRNTGWPLEEMLFRDALQA
ncbi:hypothetical protein SKAU_G00091280 [Synaphobranchus kaupii]|uniref:Uncharacterized protein n=1 Tax=Synaphobranchus kaupii TaxID=118154 RepID=A0A9Q1FXL0_SYNKA|nr:hypothetical protein SKAU_G00091280 [Synaphobranchus kaupii]